MSKIIIENRLEIGDTTALQLVMKVIANGKISGSTEAPQYCYHTVFEIFGFKDGISVSAFKNEKSDRFVVH